MGEIVVTIMILFSIIAGLDKAFGNRLGLGEHFVQGFNSMGPLALIMLGLYTISPVIGKSLLPILSPFTKLFGIDPSLFIGAILAPDMGGYSTSILIATNDKLGLFSSLILGSMLGSTVIFTIPIAIGIISKEDCVYFTKGVLFGFITIPFGCFIGGILMKVPVTSLFLNIVPIIIFSILISVGLYKAPNKMFKLFNNFGKAIITISTIGLLISILEFMLNITLIKGLIPLQEGLIVVGKIAIILSGAYPLVYVISKLLNPALSKFGKLININSTSALGLITSLTNCIPMLMLYKDMDRKGKIINAAFAVSASFVLGGQLGFVSGVEEQMVLPFMVSKLTAGSFALILAVIMLRSENTVENAQVLQV